MRLSQATVHLENSLGGHRAIRPDDVSVNGSNGLNAVNKWIDGGSLALQKEHGFPPLSELLTSTVQLRVLPGDDRIGGVGLC